LADAHEVPDREVTTGTARGETLVSVAGSVVEAASCDDRLQPVKRAAVPPKNKSE
jgi:hypothetical protein